MTVDAKDPQVKQLLAELLHSDAPRHALLQKVRTLVHSLVPGVAECVKYGGIMFGDMVGGASGASGFCAVFAYADHATVEFGRGHELKDPHQVLEGKGKYRRHIKLHEADDIDSKHLRSYIGQAYRNSHSADAA